ncbi:MAG TPA: hypothetical protein PKD53_31165 [Chloroflexaceae bacterium]|nr:hypothetical protein [Chloroflexaceae bacterium]
MPGGTVLDTMGAAGDYAGFFTVPGSLPALSRTDGYTLTFTAQVFAETHELDSRAGFTALVLGDDRKGIELAFWPDEVWAQNDGANDPTAGQGLFTHGEGAPFDTTARPVTYSVAVRGDRYMLLADGDLLLEGPLRRYRPGLGENPLALSYYFGNAIFLGDNTSRAAARVLLTGAALETAAAPPPPAPSPEPSPSPVSPVPAQTPQVYLPTLVL